jgi:hypothetical protein
VQLVYCVGQGKGRWNKGTTRNEEEQTKKRKEEKLAGTPT